MGWYWLPGVFQTWSSFSPALLSGIEWETCIQPEEGAPAGLPMWVLAGWGKVRCVLEVGSQHCCPSTSEPFPAARAQRRLRCLQMVPKRSGSSSFQNWDGCTRCYPSGAYRHTPLVSLVLCHLKSWCRSEETSGIPIFLFLYSFLPRVVCTTFQTNVPDVVHIKASTGQEAPSSWHESNGTGTAGSAGPVAPMLHLPHVDWSQPVQGKPASQPLLDRGGSGAGEGDHHHSMQQLHDIAGDWVISSSRKED